jgi:SAM-dependent methyltransferase
MQMGFKGRDRYRHEGIRFVMTDPKGGKAGLVRQLERQSEWLKESWLWLVDDKITKIRKMRTLVTPISRALDVGCGPGFVMDIMRSEFEVEGVDIDPDMVDICKSKGFRTKQGEAKRLPFKDSEFDVVYCSFLLLWVKDPVKVVKEMARVSNKWVICLAEPDYGARIDHPEGVNGLNSIIANGIMDEGGDPLVGRKLGAIFSKSGLEAEVGVHPGVWNLERLREEFEAEWRFVEGFAKGRVPENELGTIKTAWRKALDEGSLFQYNPIFHAFAKK